MNHNQPFVPNQPYAPQRVQNVRIMLDRKMFYQQQMVALFGAARMGEVMASPDPFILPVVHYQFSFDVTILILS